MFRPNLSTRFKSASCQTKRGKILIQLSGMHRYWNSLSNSQHIGTMPNENAWFSIPFPIASEFISREHVDTTTIYVQKANPKIIAYPAKEGSLIYFPLGTTAYFSSLAQKMQIMDKQLNNTEFPWTGTNHGIPAHFLKWLQPLISESWFSLLYLESCESASFGLVARKWWTFGVETIHPLRSQNLAFWSSNGSSTTIYISWTRIEIVCSL
jgi:hypothetical protein